MAITCGFFNSVDGDRKYDATQFASLFDGVITDGVVAAVGDFFATTPGGGMVVNVGTGRAWFNRTWTYNDAIVPLEVAAADLLYDRIDAVVLEVDVRVSIRDNSIKIVTGTASSDPINPDMVDTGDVHQHPLAYIRVRAGTSNITEGDITINVGKATCPFVTSIVDTPDLSVLFSKWEAQFTEWFENIQSQLEGDIATNLQNQINQRVKIADKATTSEAQTGTNDTKWMTPLKTSQAIAAHRNTGMIKLDNVYKTPIRLSETFKYAETVMADIRSSSGRPCIGRISPNKQYAAFYGYDDRYLRIVNLQTKKLLKSVSLGSREYTDIIVTDTHVAVVTGTSGTSIPIYYVYKLSSTSVTAVISGKTTGVSGAPQVYANVLYDEEQTGDNVCFLLWYMSAPNYTTSILRITLSTGAISTIYSANNQSSAGLLRLGGDVYLGSSPVSDRYSAFLEKVNIASGQKTIIVRLYGTFSSPATISKLGRTSGYIMVYGGESGSAFYRTYSTTGSKKLSTTPTSIVGGVIMMELNGVIYSDTDHVVNVTSGEHSAAPTVPIAFGKFSISDGLNASIYNPRSNAGVITEDLNVGFVTKNLSDGIGSVFSVKEASFIGVEE